MITWKFEVTIYDDCLNGNSQTDQEWFVLVLIEQNWALDSLNLLLAFMHKLGVVILQNLALISLLMAY